MLYEIIPFVSEGILYPNKQEFVKLFHLTTEDELFISASNNLNNPNVLYDLLSTKISDLPFDFNDMLLGDANTLISYLREVAYGTVFEAEISGGEDKEIVEIDLTKLLIKKIDSINPRITLPKCNKSLVLRFLTVNDQRQLNLLKHQGKPIMLQKMKLSIKSVEDNEDKDFISKFVDKMLALDSSKLRKYIENHEFGLSTKYPFKSSTMELPIDLNLFGLSLDTCQKFANIVNDEIYVLVKHGRFSYMDIMKMPTYQRKFFITKLYNEAIEKKKLEEAEISKNRKQL